jgi:hypothetical protein
MSKVPVCIRDEYLISLEYFQDRVWFHVTFKKWSVETKKKFSVDVKTVLNLLNDNVLALVREDNTKLMKFAKSFDWHMKGQTMLKDGTKAYIYSPKGGK